MRVLGYAVVALTVFSLIVLVDLFIGSLNNLADVRIESRQFRSEAASLGLNVKGLVPGVDHQYRDPSRPDAVRTFRVDPKGGVAHQSRESGDGRLRINFLGGSTTENNEVNEDKRFPAAVETLLNNAGILSKTSNYGVRGHTTQESILSYITKPHLRDADLVILMHNINDRLWLSKFSEYFYRSDLSSPTTWKLVTDSFKSLTAVTWDYITYESNIIFLIRQRFEYFNPWNGEANNPGVVSERNIAIPKIDSTYGQTFAQNLKIFVALVRSTGAEPVLMTQPLAHESAGHEIFNKIIREVAARSDVLLIDLAKKMRENGSIEFYFLQDGIHFNDAGSFEAARIITGAISHKVGKQPVEKAGSLGNIGFNALSQECNVKSTRLEALSPPLKASRVLDVPGRYPVISADGTWLLFQSWLAGKESLYAYRTRDAKIFRLSPSDPRTPNERHPAILRFSDNYLKFVFGSGYIHGSSELERLKVREWPSMQTDELFQDQTLGGSIPAVQGNIVFFAGYKKEGSLATPNIMSKNLESHEIKYITKDDNEDWRPALSSDGDLAFISKRGSKFELHEKSGSGVTRKLFEHHSDIWDPTYSQDGRMLAFAAKEGKNWVIKLLNRKSGIIIQLTDGKQDDWDPAFHPNSNILFFGRSYGQEPYIYGVCLGSGIPN